MSDHASEPDSAEPDGQLLSLERSRVQRAQRGDRGALQQLLQQHASALYGAVLLPRVGDSVTAEDLLRATMLTAIEKLHHFRWEGRSIYHWLRRIAINKAVDYHRQRQRGHRLADRLSHEGELPGLGPAAPPGPEAALIAEQEQALNRRRVQETLDKLRPRYRTAIELRLMQELPRQDCAAQLQVSVGTFDVLFFRALRAFRRAFEGA